MISVPALFVSSLHIYDNINRNYYVLKERSVIMHWTIIGGGLQGTTIAIQLRELGLSRDKLTIIDPYATHYVNNSMIFLIVSACPICVHQLYITSTLTHSI